MFAEQYLRKQVTKYKEWRKNSENIYVGIGCDYACGGRNICDVLAALPQLGYWYLVLSRPFGLAYAEI